MLGLIELAGKGAKGPVDVHRTTGETEGRMDQLRIYLFSSCTLQSIALELLSGAENGIVLVGTEPAIPSQCAALADFAPDVALVDAELLRGRSVTDIETTLKPLCETTPVLLLAGHLDIPVACAAIAAGARGHILASVTLHDFMRVLQVVAAGGVWLSSELMRAIAYHADAQLESSSQPVRLLSEREQQILNSVARGNTSKDIAKTLFLSESSVRTYWYRVLTKLNASNKAEAIARAARLGLLDVVEREQDEVYLTAGPKLKALLRTYNEQRLRA